MNVDRMRRYIARTTPDEISREFTSEEIANHEPKRWGDWFRSKMNIKHSRVPGEIHSFAEQEFFTRNVKVTMIWKERRPKSFEDVYKTILTPDEIRKEMGLG